MDKLEEIKLLESQIVAYQVTMQNCYSPSDLAWYTSQIRGLEEKIKKLKE